MILQRAPRETLSRTPCGRTLLVSSARASRTVASTQTAPILWQIPVSSIHVYDLRTGTDKTLCTANQVMSLAFSGTIVVWSDVWTSDESIFIERILACSVDDPVRRRVAENTRSPVNMAGRGGESGIWLYETKPAATLGRPCGTGTYPRTTATTRSTPA